MSSTQIPVTLRIRPLASTQLARSESRVKYFSVLPRVGEHVSIDQDEYRVAMVIHNYESGEPTILLDQI